MTPVKIKIHAPTPFLYNIYINYYISWHVNTMTTLNVTNVCFQKYTGKPSMKTQWTRLKCFVYNAFKCNLNIYRLCIFKKYHCPPANAVMTIIECIFIWERRVKLDDQSWKLWKRLFSNKFCKYLLTKVNYRKYFWVIYFLVVWSRSSWHTFHFHIGEYSDVRRSS